MSATSSARRREWSGPAILSFGFRPFFFGAAVWAALAMALWLAELSGRLALPSAFDPVSWHAHEFLFGYLGAVMAGFLLTAVPNWTGRLPVVGWPLAGLAGLWLVGRGAIAFSEGLSAALVAALDLAFPVALALYLAREIIVGRNWRNLIVLALLVAFIAGNALFHWQAAQGAYAAGGAGLRLGLGTAIMMIAVIGGRIVPSFTRNWLARQGGGRLPVPPMQRFDKLALLGLLAALVLWVAWPEHPLSGGALILAGVLHLRRLARWAGARTLAEPLVTVLHVGYAFVPLGSVVLGAAILEPQSGGVAAAQHLWMAGAIGMMTLAVMTRATLGHGGQALTAGPATVAIYAAVLIATFARLGAGVWPDQANALYMLAGAAWMAGFGGFAVVYGKLLLRRHRPAARQA